MIKVNPAIYITLTGARGIGKTHLLETVIVPALQQAGYDTTRVSGERVIAIALKDPPNAS